VVKGKLTKYPMVSIIIPTHNGKDSLRNCLTLIKKRTVYPNFEVIVVGAASTDGTYRMVKQEFPNVRVIKTGDVGYGEANNIGILHSSSELVVSIEDGHFVEPYWLNALVDVLLSSEDIGVVGSTVYNYSESKYIPTFGGKIGPTGDTPPVTIQGKELLNYDHIEVDYVSILMVRKKIFDLVGLWDPVYFVLFDETDFCYRVKKEGYKIVCTPHSIVWHKVSPMNFIARARERTEKRIFYYYRNRIRFIIKNFSVLKIFPGLVHTAVLILMLLLFSIAARKQTHIRSLIATIVWNARHLKDTLNARLNPLQYSVKRTRLFTYD